MVLNKRLSSVKGNRWNALCFIVSFNVGGSKRKSDIMNNKLCTKDFSKDEKYGIIFFSL